MFVRQVPIAAVGPSLAVLGTSRNRRLRVKCCSAVNAICSRLDMPLIICAQQGASLPKRMAWAFTLTVQQYLTNKLCMFPTTLGPNRERLAGPLPQCPQLVLSPHRRAFMAVLGRAGLWPRSFLQGQLMIAHREPVQKIASRMLARYGMVFIWDTHIAAAAAYGLGNKVLAEDLIEIAEAAEEVWLQPSLRERRTGAELTKRT